MPEDCSDGTSLEWSTLEARRSLATGQLLRQLTVFVHKSYFGPGSGPSDFVHIIKRRGPVKAPFFGSVYRFAIS
jgi:hypothetical protein